MVKTLKNPIQFAANISLPVILKSQIVKNVYLMIQFPLFFLRTVLQELKKIEYPLKVNILGKCSLNQILMYLFIYSSNSREYI